MCMTDTLCQPRGEILHDNTPRVAANNLTENYYYLMLVVMVTWLPQKGLCRSEPLPSHRPVGP